MILPVSKTAFALLSGLGIFLLSCEHPPSIDCDSPSLASKALLDSTYSCIVIEVFNEDNELIKYGENFSTWKGHEEILECKGRQTGFGWTGRDNENNLVPDGKYTAKVTFISAFDTCSGCADFVKLDSSALFDIQF